MHSIVATFREAVIKVEVANFGAAIDTLIDQDASAPNDTCKNLMKCHFNYCSLLIIKATEAEELAITVNPPFEPRGLINFMAQNHPG